MSASAKKRSRAEIDQSEVGLPGVPATGSRNWVAPTACSDTKYYANDVEKLQFQGQFWAEILLDSLDQVSRPPSTASAPTNPAQVKECE